MHMYVDMYWLGCKNTMCKSTPANADLKWVLIKMQWITEDLLLNAALGSRMQQGGAAALPREAHWTIDRALLEKKNALRDDLWKLQGF